jgi:phosphoglycerate dehydrogenase-like enzyme
MRIAILDDYQNIALEMADWSAVQARAEIDVFTDHLVELDDIATRLQPHDVILAMRERTPFPRALIERLPALKLLAITGNNTGGFDVEAATERGIVISGTGGGEYTFAESELTWALILALARNVTLEDRTIREGGWLTGLGTRLYGKVLGVIGLGRIGARVAAIGKFMGMEVIAWSENLTPERCAEVGVAYADKETLLGRADVLTIHLRLGERSIGTIGAPDLARMKPTAFLINISRGPIVDEAALIDALERGVIAGAGLDVYSVEPLPVDDPMRRAPNTVLMPHVGYVTDASYLGFYEQSAENVLAFMDGEPMRVLNPAVLEDGGGALPLD